MKKIKTLEDLDIKPGTRNFTGIIYDIDKEFIYVLDIIIDGRLFYSSGDRYKLKHNFTQDEIDRIETGTYINVPLKCKTKCIYYNNIRVKKAKKGHRHKEYDIFEMLD